MRGRLSARWAAIAVAWAAAMFWASSQPSPFFLPRPFLSHDKLLHALAYAVLAALVYGALAPARLGALRGVVLAAALSTAYGATDELHQAFVPGRSADPRDLAADAIGAIAGAAAAAALRSRRAARPLAGQGDAG
jgi:VanZ family protein